MTAQEHSRVGTGAELPCIVGRSSSHFTRVVRMFAAECQVNYTFEVVPHLLSEDPKAYGGNPGLRLPNLNTAGGTIFGALNSCRALYSLAQRSITVLWPEAVVLGTAANAQELTLQAMSTEVTLILSTSPDTQPSPYARKLQHALTNMLAWIDHHLWAAQRELPPRDVSYFELALFCLLEHLEFRHVASLATYAQLRSFRDHFAQRESARATPFEFDS